MYFLYINGAWSDFSEFGFLFKWYIITQEISWFQISLESVKPFWYMKRLRILQLPIHYCTDVSINTFQTVHFSAVKLTSGNEKMWAFFWYQNLRKFEQYLKQLDRAPLSDVTFYTFCWHLVHTNLINHFTKHMNDVNSTRNTLYIIII